MKFYIVYTLLGIDGIDENSIKIFEYESDAIAYSFALKTHKHYPLYYDVKVLEKEVI